MTVTLKKESKRAVLYIYGPIGNEWNGITAGEVAEQLDKAGGVESLTVRINSEGGMVSDGIAIMNRLAAFEAPIHVEVDGLAASAASTIAMAGDRITMGTGSFLMIHEPWVQTVGNSADLRKTADVLDLINAEAAAIYSSRSGLDVGQITEMMAAETWMNSEQAIELKFADDAVEREAVSAKWNLSHFTKTPDVIAAMCRPEPVATRRCLHRMPKRDVLATKLRIRRKFAADRS